MKNPRKISDIWKAIDHQRNAFNMKEIIWRQSYEGIKAAIEYIGHQRNAFNMKEIIWRQSYEGIKAAIEYIGLQLITKKKDFDAIEIPLSTKKIKKYGYRNIVVARNGYIYKAARINDILSGQNGLKTDEELEIIYTNLGIANSIVKPKGIATNNNIESKSIDDLDELISISNFMYREHLVEFRRFDIAYCLINDDINGEVFVADQVKSSRVAEDGRLHFNELNVKKMISILEKNGSLTCIGKNKENIVDVVWFFFGNKAIDILKEFNMTQTFHPRLHLQVKSNNPFTIAMNNPMFRFDIGKIKSECNRLLQQKLEFIKIGQKHSLTFWNEDDSQIPSINNRIEQKSFNMTCNACNTINIKVSRKHEDAYGPVDFRINGTIRIQDKVSRDEFKFRPVDRYPYNPDDIDIFQVSDIVNQIVYAIPMRVLKNDIITSFFTSEQLMKTGIRLSVEWKENHKQFKYNFKNKADILSYVKACEDAAKIPKLSDQNFYQNMIDENKIKFIPKKKIKEKKIRLKVDEIVDDVDEIESVESIKIPEIKQEEIKKSDFRGVSYHKNSKKYRATLMYNKIIYNIGEYKDESEAALAYNLKVIEVMPKDITSKYLNVLDQDIINKGVPDKKKVTSKYNGVSWHKASEKWRSSIRFNKKYYELGVYKNEIDAAIAYNKKAQELYTDLEDLNKRLNIID
jgi:hypothetical protein